jgi:hypothetical protein
MFINLRVMIPGYRLYQVQSNRSINARSAAIEYERLSAIRFAKQIGCVTCGAIVQQLEKFSS